MRQFFADLFRTRRRVRHGFVLIFALVFSIVLLSSPVFAQSTLVLTVSHTGSSGNDFVVGSNTGTITISVRNDGPVDTTVDITDVLPAGLTYNATVSSVPGGLFSCSGGTTVTCSTGGSDLTVGSTETVTFSVLAQAPRGTNLTNAATAQGSNAAQVGASDPVAFNVIGREMTVAVSHSGNSGNDFIVSTTDGTVSVAVSNIGEVATDPGNFTLFVTLQDSLIYNAYNSSSGLFTCPAPPSANSFVCNAIGATFGPGVTETITFTVTAPGSAQPGPFNSNATLLVPGGVNYDTNSSNNFASDPVSYSIVNPPTATPLPTGTPTATLTPLPTVTPPPPPSLTPTRTLIPPLPSRTPLPRPANAGQAIPIPPSGISVVTNRDGVNVRLFPAIGAEVIGNVPAGFVFENISARSANNEWVRVDYFGEQGWVGFPVITVLNGADIGVLPVADPRTIPYGGFEQPRAGETSATSPYTGRLALSGLRLRAGPSRAYPVLANPPRYTVFPLLGRTANNRWFQVNFEGTLGWVTAEFVELSSAEALTALPIDGIIADGLPISQPTGDSYVDTLRLMLARLDIAQRSLDEIRNIWTSISLGQTAQCGNYPSRPSDFNIPLPLLSAFAGTLVPLQRDFNAAMGFLRQAIDLFIESCSFAQPPEGLVGAGGASVALLAVNEADSLMIELRETLIRLIPEDVTLTDEVCLFQFADQYEVVTRLRNGVAILVSLTADDLVLGFCFDGTAGETYRIEAVRANGNIQPQIVVSMFDEPTNFLAVGQITADNPYVGVSNILIPRTGQVLVIVSDISSPEGRNGPINGDLALLLTNTTGFSGALAPGLAIDPNTGLIIVNPEITNVLPTPDPNLVPPPANSNPGFNPADPINCPDVTLTCSQLLTCDQARACLAAGNVSLDTDFDGIPCEENLCAGAFFPTLTPLPTQEGI